MVQSFSEQADLVYVSTTCWADTFVKRRLSLYYIRFPTTRDSSKTEKKEHKWNEKWCDIWNLLAYL